MSKIKRIPFDAEKAKKGAKIVTRCGYPVKIGRYNANGEYPIRAIVEDGDGDSTYSFTVEGKFDADEDSELDLFIEEEEQEKTRREYSGTDSIFVPNDDEGIIEELIDAINGLSDNDALPMPLSVKRKEAWLAWLEKQGEKNTADVTPKFKVAEDDNKTEKETKKRRMTYRELSQWLRNCPNEFREFKQFGYVASGISYYISEADIPVNDTILIRRKYGKWEEPLIEE